MKRMLVVLLILLLLTGCSTGTKRMPPGGSMETEKDGSVVITTPGGSVDTGAQNGTGQAPANNGGNRIKIPQGFPHELMEGYVTESASRSEMTGAVLYDLSLRYSGKDIQSIADFYEAKMRALGVDISRSESVDSQGSMRISLSGFSGKVGASTSLEEDAEDQTVTVSFDYTLR